MKWRKKLGTLFCAHPARPPRASAFRSRPHARPPSHFCVGSRPPSPARPSPSASPPPPRPRPLILASAATPGHRLCCLPRRSFHRRRLMGSASTTRRNGSKSPPNRRLHPTESPPPRLPLSNQVFSYPRLLHHTPSLTAPPRRHHFRLLSAGHLPDRGSSSMSHAHL
jgi:hypothetical protein